MKTILLTGATGFLGSHLLEALLLHNYDVIITKRTMSDTWRINHLLHKVNVYNTDVDSINKIFTNNSVDVIIHMATLYRKFDNGQEVKEMVESNVSFPVELLEAAVRHGVKGFINSGTFFEYDCSVLPVNENAKLKPFNLYAKTKLSFETILATYSDLLNIMTLRLFSPYGEKDNLKLIPMVIQKALSNERIELSDGLQKLDFIYAADITDAYIRALARMNEQHEANYKVYNIGSGACVSVREVVSIIEQQLGKTIDKYWGMPSKVDIPIAFADIAQAETDLGWFPSHNIHDGIEKTIEFYKKGLSHVD